MKKYIVKCRECLEALAELANKNNSLEVRAVAELFNKTDSDRTPVPEFALDILRKNMV